MKRRLMKMLIISLIVVSILSLGLVPIFGWPTAIVISGVIVGVLAVWYYSIDITESECICANCGSLSKSFGKPSSEKREVCSVCGRSEFIPKNSPRGIELHELYHGAVRADQRLRTAHEATRKLIEKLEGFAPSSTIADELGKLVRLVQEGALSADEWQRAKDLILGTPRDKQVEAIDRVSKLFRAYQSGALSQSEFNMTKWDILSRIGQVK